VTYVTLSTFCWRLARFRRLLVPGGALIVCTPGASHLREARDALGLIGIDARKDGRLADAFGGYTASAIAPVRYELRLGHAELTDLVAMGPNARHTGADALAARVATLPDPFPVTVDVTVRGLSAPGLSTCRRIIGTWRPRPSRSPDGRCLT